MIKPLLRLNELFTVTDHCVYVHIFFCLPGTLYVYTEKDNIYAFVILLGQALSAILVNIVSQFKESLDKDCQSLIYLHFKSSTFSSVVIPLLNTAKLVFPAHVQYTIALNLKCNHCEEH